MDKSQKSESRPRFHLTGCVRVILFVLEPRLLLDRRHSQFNSPIRIQAVQLLTNCEAPWTEALKSIPDFLRYRKLHPDLHSSELLTNIGGEFDAEAGRPLCPTQGISSDCAARANPVTDKEARKGTWVKRRDGLLFASGYYEKFRQAGSGRLS